MSDIILINNFMQANALSIDYYTNAKLSNQQNFLALLVWQKYINNNTVYYNQAQSTLSSEEFTATTNIMNSVRSSALKNKPFPKKQVTSEAAVFGTQSAAVVQCAQSMYNTIIAMKKDPSYSISTADFTALVNTLYAQSQGIPQAPEATDLLKEFTRATAGVQGLVQNPTNVTKSLQNIGRRLGAYIVIDSTTPTQNDSFMPMAGTFFLRYENIGTDLQSKLKYILQKNYGNSSGMAILNDIKQIPNSIDAIKPKAMLTQFAMTKQTNSAQVITAEENTVKSTPAMTLKK